MSYIVEQSGAIRKPRSKCHNHPSFFQPKCKHCSPSHPQASAIYRERAKHMFAYNNSRLLLKAYVFCTKVIMHRAKNQVKFSLVDWVCRKTIRTITRISAFLYQRSLKKHLKRTLKV